MTGQRRKQAQMGEHSRMNRTEFMRQLESLLQNISATEREEALQYYNEYFNDAGPENEQNVIEALGNPVKVAENIKKDIFGNGYGENIYQKINADNRAVITYPADSGAERQKMVTTVRVIRRKLHRHRWYLHRKKKECPRA